MSFLIGHHPKSKFLAFVPAAVGRYTIRPHGRGIGGECATLKAYVRA